LSSQATVPPQPYIAVRGWLRPLATAGFYLTLAVLVAGGAYAYRSVRKIAAYHAQVRSTNDLLVTLESLLSTMKDAETGQRGYLLTGDTKYLGPYHVALGTVNAQLAQLTTFTGGDELQRSRLDSLKGTISLKLGEMAATLSLADHEDHAGAVALVRSDTGMRLMDHARQIVAAMQRQEQDRRNRLTLAADDAGAVLAACIGLTIGLAALLVTLVRLLTKRYAREQAIATAVLAAQKELMRVTLASIGDGVITTDVDGRVTSMNAVAEDLCGWRSADALNQPLTTIFNIVNEDTRAPVNNPAVRALATGAIVGLANHTVLIARDGRERPIEDSAAPIRSDDGTILGCVLVFRDASVGRDAEMLARAQHAEVRQLAADLSEAGRRKDEFLATLAHELRNPLAPIRNGLQLLRLSRQDHTTPAAMSDTIAMIDRQVGQLVRLVDDLLDVSRISRGKQQLRRERANLATILEHALETSRPVMQSRGHRVRATIPAEPVIVDADPTRLEQVFTNLLNNAAKYSDDAAAIELVLTTTASDAVVQVRDGGIGISAELLPHIFDLFTQAAAGLDRSEGGLGIGLTLVRGLVEMHGGEVEARSNGPGTGSEFVVTLPLATIGNATPAPASAGGAPARAAARSLRVLVADDNNDSASTLGRLLEAMGHLPRIASNGAAALSAVAEFDPEVIFLDIGMPTLNGYEVCQRIRAATSGGGPFIVALTGWGQESDKRRSAAAGFDRHLVKPLEPATLEEVLAAADRG
jgi:PAS domain S-box-containing protein